MTRYALYYAPESKSTWSMAGCRWLGRDAFTGEAFPPCPIPGVPALLSGKLTASARRYGFHATLKAPFTLAEGFDETHLVAMALAFSATQNPVALEGLQVRLLGNFLALCPHASLAEVDALAMRCVAYFDLLRAPPTGMELEKRRHAKLNARQETLLQRWGYPYTEEEFRLHLTLTDALSGVDGEAVYAIRKAAEQHFAEACSGPPPLLDALTIFRESEPGSPFTVWRRFPFPTAPQHSALPAPGRLFYVVGPSGAGKDSLLRWLQTRLPDSAGVVFARRTITRPEHDSEAHESIDVAAFWRQAAAGQFAMIWQANGLCYGIRRGMEAALKAGCDVVINGSREYVPQLHQSFPEAQVIWVEAAFSAIQARLEARNRETGAALLQRLDRVTRFCPPTERVIRVDNSGPLDVAGQQLLRIMKR